MSKNPNDSGKLKLAKYILTTLREIQVEKEKSELLGKEAPSLEISIDKLTEDLDFTVEPSALTSSEVIRGMFFKRRGLLIPYLGTMNLAEFNDELEEQIKMFEGAFGREGLGRFQGRHIESGFVHSAARRK